ncbi:MAG: four helix bundle protein [Bacteroidota bacterium]|jgi:four helix bundle protein|nr:four helix bundle protein [Bacteroidota bacterium]
MQFNFEKLITYQKSLDYVDFAYRITEGFPKIEQFSLTDQFRRAAVSISLNIGEGSSGTKKEFMNFLRISNRSLRECVVCTSIAYRRKYISEEIHNKSREQLVEIAKLNSGLLNSLKTPNDNRKPSTNYKLQTLN